MPKANVRTILDKLLITGDLTLVTGMHIGASNDFSPIGAVDSVVVRDPLSRRPIIPGSSLKGKMRTLLAKTEANTPFLKEFDKDSPLVCRLFGTAKHEEFGIRAARLQFFDLFLKEESVKKFEDKTDLFLTEIKFENTINRLDSVANPRQIERVPAGSEFMLKLVYNVETSDDYQAELLDDFDTIARALKLIQVDYIGGHGTRGYGKVQVANLKVTAMNVNDTKETVPTEEIAEILKGAENFGFLPV